MGRVFFINDIITIKEYVSNSKNLKLEIIGIEFFEKESLIFEKTIILKISSTKKLIKKIYKINSIVANTFNLLIIKTNNKIKTKYLLAKDENSWWVYIIKTSKGTLYTGISKDPYRRFSEHKTNKKKRAKYFASHIPIELYIIARCNNLSKALKLEIKTKKLKKKEKILKLQYKLI